MKYLILLLLFLGPGYASQPNESCTHSPSSFKCVSYVRNYDGDTVTFDIKDLHPLFGEKINVRLYGVDTPEIRTKDKCEKEKGRVAKKLVANLLKNAKRIDLENVRRDKYFRILADIKFDDKSLSQILIKNGLAYAYFGETKPNKNWCDLDREVAKEKKK